MMDENPFGAVIAGIFWFCITVFGFVFSKILTPIWENKVGRFVMLLIAGIGMFYLVSTWSSKSGINQTNLSPSHDRTILRDNDKSLAQLPMVQTPLVKPQSQSKQERISGGEKVLIINKEAINKRAGAVAYAKGDFTTAVNSLDTSRKINRNDPETLIYLNNARIGNKISHNIAIAVPIGHNTDIANEILRGTAQAQDEINQAGGIKGIPLKAIIINDENNPQVASEVADAVVKNSSVLGVVGHFGSDATLEAAKVYQKGQLVVISPTSTSIKLSGFGNYVFRTVANDKLAGESLGQYMTTQGWQKAAIFFNSDSDYSKSLTEEFTTALQNKQGKIVKKFDLASSTFKAKDNLEEAMNLGAEVVALFPSSKYRDQALKVARVTPSRLRLLGGDSLYQKDTLEQGKDNVLDMVVAVSWHGEANSQAEFTKNADRLWGADVNWRSAMAYDATKALIAALQQNPTRSGVQKALSATNFSAQGASGVVNFLQTGDRNGPIQLVKIIRDENSRSGTGYDFVPLQ
jgi:branched-chain amino acid transport system substrate-binding protein